MEGPIVSRLLESKRQYTYYVLQASWHSNADAQISSPVARRTAVIPDTKATHIPLKMKPVIDARVRFRFHRLVLIMNTSSVRKIWLELLGSRCHRLNVFCRNASRLQHYLVRGIGLDTL
jgi:hypothetical protein